MQFISQDQARAAAGRPGLNAEQRAAVVMMLTAAAATTVLIAPAGAGKSHTMAGFARLWTTFTGRRVIDLTTSTNAARVLQHEGLAESYNIAEFLGKTEGSDELRRPVPLHQDDVLVLDEASQLSTIDLAMIGEASRQAGARIIATGDTAQLAGHDTGALIDQITAAHTDRARSIASVLHYRLQQLALPDLRHDVTWAQRTPASAPPAAHELAAALDDRARTLGERMAASPEPWLARRFGVLAPGASPALREEYTRRAGTAAAYREAAVITNPEQAVSPEPHRNQPELEAMRKAVFAALEIRDEADIIGGLDRGELEARALHGQRARAVAPPDVSSQLRLTAQAEADAFQQSADARTPHDHTGAASPIRKGNRMRSQETNRRRRPDGGASSRPMPKPPNAPSPVSTRPPSLSDNPGRPRAHPSRISGRLRRRARRISRCLPSPRRTTGQRG